MRENRKSRFIRFWQERDVRSVRSFLLLPILIPIIVMKVILIGILATVIFTMAEAFPSALDQVAQAVRAAKASDKTDEPFLFVKGGEFRQAGDLIRGSKARFAEPKSGDDLRHRLDELRSMRIGDPTHRTPRNGGQYGKQ